MGLRGPIDGISDSIDDGPISGLYKGVIMSFIDHAHKTVYIKASANNEQTKAAQSTAYLLGYAVIYLLRSL